MGLFDGIKNQFASVVEWADMDENSIFLKWTQSELKKGSRLIIRPGQDALFLYQGKVVNVFQEEGDYDIESKILPVISNILGFKFGFDTGMRAEILFVNTREFSINWGTANALNLPAPGLPGGMPIRAFGMFTCKVGDYSLLIDKIAGVQPSFTTEDLKARLGATNDQLLMKWIVKEGKDMFNIQANAYDIGRGIIGDLNTQLNPIGMEVTDYMIQSVSYPEKVKEMQEKAAANAMVGDINSYTSIAFADSMANGGGGDNAASSMAQLAMGMQFAQQMMNNMNQQNQQSQQFQQAAPQQAAAPAGDGTAPKFCPNCGTPTNGAKFCSNCGTKLF